MYDSLTLTVAHCTAGIKTDVTAANSFMKEATAGPTRTKTCSDGGEQPERCFNRIFIPLNVFFCFCECLILQFYFTSALFKLWEMSDDLTLLYLSKLNLMGNQEGFWNDVLQMSTLHVNRPV